MDLKYLKKILWISLFAIAMGYLESSVVVYLREIYYPAGFDFPLAPIDVRIAITEIFRELATMIMLVLIGFFVGKTVNERFAWFIYTFAIWDIFYYIFLKLLVDWPESIFTWDILFLIPVIWVGPVISPIIVSLTMIALALIITWFSDKGAHMKIGAREWWVFIIGSIILIVAFTWDYSSYVLEHYTISQIFTLPDNEALYDLSVNYIPRKFNWPIFLIGELVICTAIYLLVRRNKLSLDFKKT